MGEQRRSGRQESPRSREEFFYDFNEERRQKKEEVEAGPGLWILIVQQVVVLVKRILIPVHYHSITAGQRWQAILEGEAKRILYLPEGKMPTEPQVEELKRQLELLLPDTGPLLSGAIQPSDFVKDWVKISVKIAVDEEMIPGTTNNGEEKATQIGTSVQLDEIKKRKVFDLAISKEDALLEAQRAAISDRYYLCAGLLFGLTLLLVCDLLRLGITPGLDNAITSLSDLAFASILLVPPIVSLFIYSRLMRGSHHRKRNVHAQRTRLSAAMHAYETYDEIQQIRKRVEQKKKESVIEARQVIEQTREREQQKTDSLEYRIKRVEAAKVQIRDEEISQIRRLLKAFEEQEVISEQVLLRIIEILFGSTEPTEEGLGTDQEVSA